MPINKNELTKEMVEKALNVKDAKELMALAKSEGIELTKEEPKTKRKLILRNFPTLSLTPRR